MTEQTRTPQVPNTWLLQLAKLFAIFGGIGFISLVGISLYSIIGRKIANAPLTGDVELMQVGTAMSAAALLPYCTLLGEHLRVDFFTEHLSRKVRGKMDAMADILLAIFFALIAWRTGLASMDVKEAAEVSPLLSIPMWLPMNLVVPSLILASFCALYRGIAEFLGKLSSPTHSGAAE